MILILSVLKKNKAAWLAEKSKGVLLRQDFDLEKGSEDLLFYLDVFLKKEKIKLKDLTALIFLLEEASLTQVKVLTASLNTIAWQLDLPTAAKFYFSGNWPTVLAKAKQELDLKKGFKPIKIQYKRSVDITLSKKKQKYKIKP